MRRLDCRAILFDLDGVLVDSRLAVERAWTAWAGRRGLDAAEILRVAHGRRAEEVVRLFAPHLDVVEETGELEAAEVGDADGVLVADGAPALISALPPESWAVVTSGTRALASARLGSVGLPEPRAFVCAEDVANGKPEPECYLKGAELLGAEPPECVVIEDAPAGIRAARAAGMRVVAVASTHQAEQLREADVVVGSLEEVRLAGTENDGSRLVLEVEVP